MRMSAASSLQSCRTLRWLAAAPALAAVLASVGCGGNDESAPVAAAPPPAASTPVRTSQVPPGSNLNLIEARTSQAPTQAAALPTTTFDDFRLTTASTVATVSWQGIYCVETNNAAAPAATASQFIVRFYADNAGRPNVSAPLASTTVTAAGANETFERNVPNLNCGTANNVGWALYDYRATLATPVALAANTTYWVSVQAVTPSYAVFWGWRAGTTDNSLSLQLFNNTYTTLTFDRAYALLP